MHSFQTFQSWLQVYKKKQTKTFFGMQKNESLWNTFCTMESLYQSTYRKSLFTLNASERNAYAYAEQRTKNGKFLKKLRNTTNSGDFYTIQNLPSQLLNFYRKKKILEAKISFLFFWKVGCSQVVRH